MRRVNVVIAVVLLAFAATSPLPLHAQDTPAPTTGGATSEKATDREEIEALFRKGTDFLRERKFDAALEAWKEAYLRKLPSYRDMPMPHPVAVNFMDRDALRDYMVTDMAKDYPDEKIAAMGLAFGHLGYFERDLDLKRVILDLMGAGIAGFYDPDTKALYLIKHKEDPTKKRGFFQRIFEGAIEFNPQDQKTTLAHELAHAMADQHFDLNSGLRSVLHDDDMALAYSAVVEGEATLVMMMDMLEMKGGDGRSLLKGTSTLLDSMLGSILEMSIAAVSSDGFNEAPLILTEQLVFPYAKGFALCNRMTTTGDWKAVNAAFLDPPVSTEQVLHPEKYMDETRDDPVELTLPPESPVESRWKELYTNVIGELSLEVLLRPELGEVESARVAAGWDGDVFRVWDRGLAAVKVEDENSEIDDTDGDSAPPATSLVWVSTWDTEDDAVEFAAALVKLYDDGDALEPEAAGGDVSPELVRAWAADRLQSGVWRRGADVWFVDDVPPGDLLPVLRWSLGVERRMKKFERKKFASSVEFPAANAPADDAAKEGEGAKE